MENSGSVVNTIRSGSIGGVSGVKGGALAGAIGGLLLMLVTNLSFDPSFLVFSIILGATTGMMAGALIYYFIGFGTGLLSELFFAGDGSSVQIGALWYGLFMFAAALLGYFLFPQNNIYGMLIGALLGAIAARIAIRDFVKMLAFQSAEVDPDELQTR